MTESPSNSSGENGGTKIDRVVSKYGLDGIEAEIEERWTRTDGSGDSTRDLAKYFNKAVLRQRLQDAGRDPLESELDTIYQFVSEGEISSAETIEVRERLAEMNVDPDALASDFVSHQTIYNYLTQQRGAEYDNERDPQKRLQSANDSVQKMKNRTTAMAQSNIESLRRAGILTVGEFDVNGEVYVFCQDCSSRYTLSELIDRRGCDCKNVELQP